MTTTLAQLDAAISALTAAQQNLVKDVQALIDKISTSPAATDFTNELNAVQASTSALQQADTNAQSALNPPTPTTAPDQPPTS